MQKEDYPNSSNNNTPPTTIHMKTLLKQNWYKVLIGTSMFMASSAFLIQSVSPVQAGNNIDFRNDALSDFSSSGTSGKIMMNSTQINLNGKTFYAVLVWDTETGKSKLYSANLSATSPLMKAEASNVQLPSNPL